MGYVMKEFKVGDKVFDLRHGNGVVINSNENDVATRFRNSSPTYTLLGKWMASDNNPTLFHGHDLIIEVKEPEYEWQIAVQDSDGTYRLTVTFHKSLKEYFRCCAFTPTCHIFETSKRLVKRG